MKPNVDLTENRDFMQHGHIPFKLSLSENKKIPVNVKYSNSITDYTYNLNNFFTGNRKIRYMKKLRYLLQNNIECECCGKLLNKIAWISENTICTSCNKRLGKTFGTAKIPWRK